MAATHLGPWTPLSVAEVVATLAHVPFPWWVAGGYALELHLGEAWREHEDIDVGIRRVDAPRLRAALPKWDIEIAAAGVLSRWQGEELRIDRDQNNLWCRRSPGQPWCLDVLVGEGDDDVWVYRRDERVRLPWTAAVLLTDEGVPYLAPEVQLLFKSGRGREKDDVDASQVVPRLDTARRGWLADALPPGHPWLDLLAQVGWRIEPADLALASTVAALHLRTALHAYADIFPAEAPPPATGEVLAQWEHWLGPDRALGRHGFAAKLRDETVGVVLAGPDPDRRELGHLARLYVEPDHWGTGIGRALYDAAMVDLAATGFPAVTLWVLERNHRARRWYERLGWRPTGERKATYAPAGIDDLQYRIDLG